MKEVLKDFAKKWLKQAEYDLEDAKKAKDWKSYYLSCFLSQQAAEKALKAYLYYAGVEIVWEHSVGALCKEAIKFDSTFEKVLSEARALDKYYIPTRCPDALPEESVPSEVYEENDALNTLVKAEKIFSLVKEKIRQT
ncbi:MAG: HEPN domain-containing protein [Caldimicrobium sp.]